MSLAGPHDRGAGARLSYSLLAGCAVALLPKLMTYCPESGILDTLKFSIGILMLPGAFVGLIIAAGGVHDVNPWVVDTERGLLFGALVLFVYPFCKD